MYIKPIYTRCLSAVSYLIVSDGEAAVVDPRRDVSIFLSLAAEENASIAYVIGTHTQSDFISGQFDLADKTDAQIICGPETLETLPVRRASDGERFQLGEVSFEVIHTPGHTLDSTSFLFYNKQGIPCAIFTGDTLVINRLMAPDMAVPSGLSEKDMANLLYDSVHNKIAQFPDDILVLPTDAHVSDCPPESEDCSKERYTLGELKQSHPMFKWESKADFVDWVMSNASPPSEFSLQIAEQNSSRHELLDELVERSVSRLQAHELEAWRDMGAHILDCRPAEEFMAGHVPGSIYIGLEGDMCAWLTKVIDNLNDPVVIVTPTKQHRAAITRLARVGIHNVVGYLSKGMRGWTKRETSSIEFVDTALFAKVGQIGEAIDVRSLGEDIGSRLSGARLMPLEKLQSRINELDSSKPYFIYCNNGYRSLIAASLLKRAGIEDIYNLIGGIEPPDKRTLNYN